MLRNRTEYSTINTWPLWLQGYCNFNERSDFEPVFFCSCFIFSLPLRSDRGRFSRLLFFSSLSLLLFVFFGCSDGMEREACVCDHGYERSDLCAEIIIIIIIIIIFK